MSKYQKLSESFIRKFQDKLDWSELSQNQILSEPFIREFQDKVDWYYISRYQELSEPFIREFQDKLSRYVMHIPVLRNKLVKNELIHIHTV